MENEIRTFSLRANRRFLDRSECLKEARSILEQDLIDGMTELQMAQEIYFHVCAYYFAVFRPLFGWIRDHADPIDLCSFGDTRFRRVVFSLVWITVSRPDQQPVSD